MLTIIHGDDITSSRKFFVDQVQSSKNPVRFFGETIDITNLVQALEGGALFGGQPSIFVEELLEKNKAGNRLDDIIKYLSIRSSQNFVVLWESKELSKPTLSKFGNTQIKLFAYPKKIFAFLEALRPQNKVLIPLFHELLGTVEPELVFHMIVRQFRLLIAACQQSGQIDELKRLQSWQKSRIQNQAKAFSEEKLMNTYKKLFEIDYGLKTGAFPYSLISAIDFFLTEL